MSIVRFISIGGILTAIAVICQSAPLFLPAIGLAFSPLSTLPIALAAFYNIQHGFAVFFSSAFILAFLSVQEALILLFTTGLLGIAIGTLLYRKKILVSILFSGIILFLGMISLTYLVGISAFGDLTGSLPIHLTLLIFLSFSFIYAGIWSICLRKFINYLIEIKLINIP